MVIRERENWSLDKIIDVSSFEKLYFTYRNYVVTCRRIRLIALSLEVLRVKSGGKVF